MEFYHLFTYFQLRINLHCVSKKVNLLLLRKLGYILRYPISIIFDSSIPEEICSKNVHVYSPHLFIVLILYLVKIMIHLHVFTLFSKVALYCEQQVCQVPSEFDNF